MKYVDSEIILERKIGPLIYVYIMIIIVIILSLIIICCLCRYRNYYTVRGVVLEEDNDYYIRMYIPIDGVEYVVNNDMVKIKKNVYKYSVVYVDGEFFTDNVITYQVIKIKLNIDNKYKFNNLVLDLKFMKEDKRVIDYILG